MKTQITNKQATHTIKKIIFSLCTIISINTVSAQYYQWANELPLGWRGRSILDMDVNNQGKMVVAGGVSHCLPCSNGTVTKFNSDGTFAFDFSFQSGGGLLAYANSVAIDYNGNVYVSGGVDSPPAFVGSDTVNSSGFIFKLDTGMVVKWIIENESGKLDADSAGNVYVTNNLYTRKYNKSGVLQWTAPTLQNANIAIDASKRVYLANTDSTMKISSNGLTVLYAVPRGGSNFVVNRTGNIFLVSPDSVSKLNTNGTIAWTNNTIGGNNITVDKSNNAYIINNTEIKKLNFNGTNVLWTRSSDNAPFNHIGADDSKNIYLCGNYDAANIAVLCPFKLADVLNGQTSNSQCFAAKINISTPAPFQANILTESFDGFPLYPYLCNLTPYNIPFTYCLSTGSNFAGNNEFRAEISNDNFISNITDIGLASSAVIPLSVPEGTNYRIRVVSTNPVVFGYPNTSNLAGNYIEVQDKSLSISATGNTTICSGDSVKLTATFHSSGNYYWIRNNGLPIQGTHEYYAKLNGTYYCMFQRLNCDTISNSIVITVNSKPAATITPQGPTTFCAGGSVVLSANTGAGLTYKWKKNGSYIGATLANYTATATGNYRVEVTNSNLCSRTSAATIVTVNCRAGEDIIESAVETQVYPNPIEDELNIHLKENHSNAVVKVINVTGELILQKQIPDNSRELLIDTQGWARGVYFVKVISNNGEETIKVVK